MNTSRKVRTIVLEPRMTAALFEKYQFSSPENICTDTWAAKTPIAEPQDDFFEQLEMLH